MQGKFIARQFGPPRNLMDSQTMPHSTKKTPTPEEVKAARNAAGMTQTEASETVRASMRAWQQWEGGERTMPPGLFELFMIKTGQWPLNSSNDET